LLFLLHFDHIATFGLSPAVANQIEELIEGIAGRLVSRAGTKQHASGGNVTHWININHLAPYLLLGGQVKMPVAKNDLQPWTTGLRYLSVTGCNFRIRSPFGFKKAN
jgi:hypothetical protein